MTRRLVVCVSCGGEVPYNTVRTIDDGWCRMCVSMRNAGRADLIAAVVDGRMTRDYAQRLRTRKLKAQRAEAKKTPEQREQRYRRVWGIDEEHYDRLVASHGGVCAICGGKNMRRTDSLEPKVIRLALDHDHATGRFRGLLCDGCNQGIGRFRDDPALMRRAAAYVEEYQGAKCPNGHQVYLIWSFCATCGAPVGAQTRMAL